MLGTTRAAVGALVALSVATAACGGLGVNLSSKTTANQVAITATEGTTLNPYPLLVQKTVLLVAHPSAGNVINYGVLESVRWDSNNPTVVVLLEPDCNPNHPYLGEYTTTICVFANTLGKASGNIDATTTNGAVGTLGIAITN